MQQVTQAKHQPTASLLYPWRALCKQLVAQQTMGSQCINHALLTGSANPGRLLQAWHSIYQLPNDVYYGYKFQAAQEDTYSSMLLPLGHRQVHSV